MIFAIKRPYLFLLRCQEWSTKMWHKYTTFLSLKNQATYETLIVYILEKRKLLRTLQNNEITKIYIFTDKNHIARYCPNHGKWKDKWISFWKHSEHSVDRRFSIKIHSSFSDSFNNKNDRFWQTFHTITQGE